jgi:hypothetical protein
MEDINSSHSFNLQVDNGNIPYLNEAAKWGKFLSILGFIIITIFLVCGCVFAFSGGNFSSSDLNPELQNLDLPSSTLGIIFAFYFFLIALIYFFPFLFLYRFSTKMQLAIKTNDQIVLNKSFESLKSLLKFFGVFTIIALCILLIVIIFGVVLGSVF